MSASRTQSNSFRGTLAIICREAPKNSYGQVVMRIAEGLAANGHKVHIFSESPFALKNIHAHLIPGNTNTDLLSQAHSFSRNVADIFETVFPPNAPQPTIMAFEWSAIPALLMLSNGQRTILALGSLERQRSDMRQDINRQIEQIEISGIKTAKALIVRDEIVVSKIGEIVQGVEPKTHILGGSIPAHLFQGISDPGVVKRRFTIGPIDPTVLFIGHMEEHNGPDLLMKAVPIIAKTQAQARFVFIGEGSQLWPMRVYSRYLNLDGIVRVPGHLEGQPLRELIQASDIVVIPNRKPTNDWTLFAAWAASKPVILTEEAALKAAVPNVNCLKVETSEQAIAEAVNRLLTEPGLGAGLGANGHQQYKTKMGWSAIIAQIESMIDRGTPKASNQSARRPEESPMRSI
jgi:glycosyltransferase involved in cell wall biosynthesis